MIMGGPVLQEAVIEEQEEEEEQYLKIDHYNDTFNQWFACHEPSRQND